MLSPVPDRKTYAKSDKQELMDSEVSFHLEFMKRECDNQLDEYCVFNADETHFYVNFG